jgi:hypothetical protein
LCSSFLWFVVICYAFFFLLLLPFLLRVNLHKLYLVHPKLGFKKRQFKKPLAGGS